MYYNSRKQNNRILLLNRKRKIKHLSFFLRFSIISINLLIHGSIEVNISSNNEKVKMPLIDRFHHL